MNERMGKEKGKEKGKEGQREQMKARSVESKKNLTFRTDLKSARTRTFLLCSKRFLVENHRIEGFQFYDF